MFTDATINEINDVMQHASVAFTWYRKIGKEQKALFLEGIANEIEALGDALIETASAETNLPAARLLGERGRTTAQLRMFAAMVRAGNWVEATIDKALPDRTPLPRPDLRKMLLPLGPVVVFGASNFPFAYSTAGGDTASALAAGCPVIVKAHPAHPQTGELVFGAIRKAIGKCQMHPKLFQHIHGAAFEVGKALVQHPNTAAVGFTGSSAGGRALFDYAQERLHPIPVFAEMGSVNPVVLLPDTIEKNAATLAKQYAGSITLGMGQFCTKPGILLGIESEAFTNFLQQLAEAIEYIEPAKMLHSGIHKAFVEKMNRAAEQPGVEVISQSVVEPEELEPLPTLATVSGKTFLQNPLLHEEVFGPYAIIVKCADKKELVAALKSMGGQLTTSLMGTDTDFETCADLVETATQTAGRIVFNGVPTGVEVCDSMVHGGPSPATTDSRFTAVGIDAVKRWVRPVCFQNCPQHLLPEELRD
jgi:2,5-dioxopentanoate dehydrogenase